ncbi:MAG: endonuclease/exonuclease/phosphatase family protein [Verrucomicrobiae bacterium]|nr:endonuclease/exonuclease/phosphatase family protein [Verrucomicrobiae bacterium]
MKSRFTPIAQFRWLAFTLAVVALAVSVTSSKAQSVTSGDTLCVMTYNLRYASANPPNAWPTRRPLVREVIQTVAPDVIGTQEGLYQQLKDVAADLPDYEWLGLGRDGGSRGEFMAIYYRKTRLDPLAFDHYWLSDTPEVMGSKTWGPTLPRMVTWIKFRDLRTKQEFYFINTHFDHQVQVAREKSAELIRQRVEQWNTTLPVILVGDFNARAGQNKAYHTLTEDGFFKDTWETAAARKGEGINTFNGFQAIQTNGVRIDWILTRGDVAASTTEIVTFSRDGQFPSDHFPVVTWMKLGQAK